MKFYNKRLEQIPNNREWCGHLWSLTLYLLDILHVLSNITFLT